MTRDLRMPASNISINEWIRLAPGVLSMDAVGLWHVLAAGQSRFQLDGPQLVDFVRRSIVALLDAGGIAVDSGKGTDYTWVAKSYGTTRDEIVNAIIAEWQASNGAKFDLKSNQLRPTGWTSGDAAGLCARLLHQGSGRLEGGPFSSLQQWPGRDFHRRGFEENA